MKTTVTSASLSPQTKAADLLNFNVNLLGIMTRMGLKLGFGESTVEDLCRRHGVDVNTFILVCNIYTFKDYTPSAEDLSEVHVSDIIRYLRQSHEYYLNDALTYLETGIEKMLQPCAEREKAVIRTFFHDFAGELRAHFEYEESNVFSGDCPPPEMDEDHTNIEEKVGDLKNIVMTYLPSECETMAVLPVLRFIFTLEEDLKRHTFIEDHVLMPMIGLRVAEETPRSEGSELSAREKEILVAVAKGMINKEIADLYNISIHTVITHRKNITHKTGIKTVAGLTVYAILNNLIDMTSME